MAGPVPSVFRSFQKDDKMCLEGKIVTKNEFVFVQPDEFIRNFFRSAPNSRPSSLSYKGTGLLMNVRGKRAGLGDVMLILFCQQEVHTIAISNYFQIDAIQPHTSARQRIAPGRSCLTHA